jgi:hypothetical protein
VQRIPAISCRHYTTYLRHRLQTLILTYSTRHVSLSIAGRPLFPVTAFLPPHPAIACPPSHPWQVINANDYLTHLRSFVNTQPDAIRAVAKSASEHFQEVAFTPAGPLVPVGEPLDLCGRPDRASLQATLAPAHLLMMSNETSGNCPVIAWSGHQLTSSCVVPGFRNQDKALGCPHLSQFLRAQRDSAICGKSSKTMDCRKFLAADSPAIVGTITMGRGD